MTRFLALLTVVLCLSVPIPHARADGNAALVELALDVQLDGDTVFSPLITVIEGKPASIQVGDDGDGQYRVDVLVEKVFIDEAGRQVVAIQWSLAGTGADADWADLASGQITALANAAEPASMRVDSVDGPAVTVIIGNRLVEPGVAAAGGG